MRIWTRHALTTHTHTPHPSCTGFAHVERDAQRLARTRDAAPRRVHRAVHALHRVHAHRRGQTLQPPRRRPRRLVLLVLLVLRQRARVVDAEPLHVALGALEAQHPPLPLHVRARRAPVHVQRVAQVVQLGHELGAVPAREAAVQDEHEQRAEHGQERRERARRHELGVAAQALLPVSERIAEHLSKQE